MSTSWAFLSVHSAAVREIRESVVQQCGSCDTSREAQAPAPPGVCGDSFAVSVARLIWWHDGHGISALPPLCVYVSYKGGAGWSREQS